MKNRLSIVVGAGSGLGRAIATKISSQEEPVLLIGRNRDRLEATKKLCPNPCVHVFAGDMSRRSDAIAAFDYAIGLNVPLYAVFCCAGDPAFAPIGSISDADIRIAFDGNLIAAIYCAQEGLRAYRQTGNGGHIVLVLSTAAQTAREREPLYTAAKWGARGFFLALREALKDDPVQVTAVYPGGMKTEFWDRDDHLKPNIRDFMAPEEVAEIIIRNIGGSGLATVSEIVINRGTK